MRIALIKYVFHSANPKRRKTKTSKMCLVFGVFLSFFFHLKHKHKCWSVWQANKFPFVFLCLFLHFVFSRFFVLPFKQKNFWSEINIRVRNIRELFSVFTLCFVAVGLHFQVFFLHLYIKACILKFVMLKCYCDRFVRQNLNLFEYIMGFFLLNLKTFFYNYMIVFKNVERKNESCEIVFQINFGILFYSTSFFFSCNHCYF